MVGLVRYLLDEAARRLKYSFGARIVGLDWSVVSLAPVFGPWLCLAKAEAISWRLAVDKSSRAGEPRRAQSSSEWCRGDQRG